MKEVQGFYCDSTGCHFETQPRKSPPIQIKMFSDYMCAWCYLADTMLSNLKGQYEFEVEHIGFELHGGTPENGENMNLHHPGTPQTIAYINQIGAPYGLHLCELPILANTRKALLVGEYAKSIGKGDAYVHAMWKAYLEEGRNISLVSEIKTAAQRVGIAPLEVENALQYPQYRDSLQRNMESGWAYGLNSVPTFLVNETYKLTGAQPPEVFQKIFDEILAQKAHRMEKRI